MGARHYRSRAKQLNEEAAQRKRETGHTARVNPLQSNSNSIYHGATAHLKRSFTGGFLFEAAYTMGKVIADSDSDQTATYQDVNDCKAERAPAAFDVARRSSLVGVWEIPSSKGNVERRE